MSLQSRLARFLFLLLASFSALTVSDAALAAAASPVAEST
jgi:hypothetical protein